MRHRIHQLVLVFLSTILVAVPLLVAGPLASAAPAITELALPPYPAPQINGGNYQITSGPDGALWIAYGGHNSIIRMTTSGSVTEYPMPTSQGYPADIVTGPDGALWFTEDGAAKIGRITTSGTITEYAVSAVYGYPAKITVGLDGGLWFTENASPSQAPPYSYNNTIGRITTSGVVSGYYATPTHYSRPAGITSGPDGALWFTELGANNIGRIDQNPIPSAPTSLTGMSPAQNPMLNWVGVSGANTYNIYRDSTSIGSTSNTNFTDINALEGSHSYYVTAVSSSGESAPSNEVTILVDRTAPSINYSLSSTPNSGGWNNSPVTVTFTCDDGNGSGVAVCPPPQAESVDGIYTLSGTAVDNVGNQSTVTVPVDIDQTAPTVSSVALATDPVGVNQSTTLSANVTDNLSGVSKVEYYTGSDPGQGNGTSMAVANGVATASVGNYATPGMYNYYVRAQDNAGNWSSPMSVTLDAYNPTGGYAAAHGSVAPGGSTSNTNPDDVLPMETGNNVKATFDFTVKYLDANSTMPSGISTFTWGSTCNNPHSDCFSVTTNTAAAPAVGALSWLIVPGDNTATFQGVAQLSQGSTILGNYPIRISVVGTTPTSAGHYLLQIFPVGANPATAAPLYQASGDLTGGSVVLHQ